jgi:hypothetical protein
LHHLKYFSLKSVVILSEHYVILFVVASAFIKYNANMKHKTNLKVAQKWIWKIKK